MWSDGSPVSGPFLTPLGSGLGFAFIYLTLVFFSCWTKVNFLHWQEGEPNNHNNDESCTEFRMYNSWEESGSWNDVNCESYNDWLCQIRAGKVGMKCF